ncbi:hypothetical protein PF005_g3671 [Phytophthora fragariae]|uniref:Uncharacterized protein n=1 Tax=Phytophthora fragariae TaxID=53985 RepID=A0A6A3T3I3_9STRA|nr:hypothetical protein PF003_g3509 [Phytophthora fragariae]KAE8938116.1 hypothetical protein PF009_g11993 [Phytophthora fragariae]KAE9010804.1 hypothetical protein PF011_g9666 [Phytophthora fragariae]KAE9112750.1 hypothetical protein PF007_g10995 [Phytophthora fragariae]KAE9113030.1 hypothetical protein PF010_g10227 [Phytophthora fragariae]
MRHAACARWRHKKGGLFFLTAFIRQALCWYDQARRKGFHDGRLCARGVASYHDPFF